MKKLKLRLDGMKEMLSKEQMRKINGGYYQTPECLVQQCDTDASACGEGCSCVWIVDANDHGAWDCMVG